MKNPIYPFIFGGPYWDSFLDQTYSGAGSGIGWDLAKIFGLPLDITLGIKDANFFDGRIGPFFLILAPLAIYAVFQEKWRKNERQLWAIQALALFILLSMATWVFGVINSAHLFQARLLFPGLFPLSILLSLGLNVAYSLDIPSLKISFIIRFMMTVVVCVSLLDFSLLLLVRNPLSVAIGITSRQVYMEKLQPGYTRALALMQFVPENGKVYFLFEPRSYGFQAQLQPDGLNANFLHDLWLYKTPEKMIANWKQQGYTHVLLSKIGAEFVFQDENLSGEEAVLKQVETLLDLMEASQGGDYLLYRIP